MSEKYEPSAEEMADAEGRMNDSERKMSKKRVELTPEQIELMKKCDLEFLKDGFDLLERGIVGLIDGRKVTLTQYGAFSFDDSPIQQDKIIAEKLYRKYLPIALYQWEEKHLSRGASDERSKYEQSLLKSKNIEEAHRLLDL